LVRVTAESRILLTQGFLYNFAGSEAVTFEIAHYFSALGAEVLVATHGWSDEWEREFEALARTRLFRLDDPLLEAELAENAPDLAWIHHQTIPRFLLEHPILTAFVFHHMSAFHPLEFPLAFEVERKLATAAVFAAPETREAQIGSHLLDGIEESRLKVLGNPAPRAFESASPRRPKTLERLLVVSNHIPEEVVHALELLRPDTTVTVRGSESDKGAVGRRVEPEELHLADAVLTIGKTVQYSLLAGVPVYCYDHFGGPGWLTPDNFDQARTYNFSGRSFQPKDAATIAAELSTEFEKAQADADRLKSRYASDFTLESVMESLLAETPPRVVEVPSPQEIESQQREQAFRGVFFNLSEAQRRTIEYLTGLVAHSNAERDEAQRLLSLLQSSRSFRAVSGLSRIASRLLPRRQNP
jgi:hypothetical protein